MIILKKSNQTTLRSFIGILAVGIIIVGYAFNAFQYYLFNRRKDHVIIWTEEKEEVKIEQLVLAMEK